MSHSNQDTFEGSVSDSSTEVIDIFNSSTEEKSLEELEVDDYKVEEYKEVEDDSDNNDVLIMLEAEEEVLWKVLRQIVKNYRDRDISHSNQDTFEEFVSDSSTEVIKMFDSSTEENSFV